MKLRRRDDLRSYVAPPLGDRIQAAIGNDPYGSSSSPTSSMSLMLVVLTSTRQEIDTLLDPTDGGYVHA